MPQIEDAVNLRQVPAQPARQFGPANALLAHRLARLGLRFRGGARRAHNGPVILAQQRDPRTEVAGMPYGRHNRQSLVDEGTGHFRVVPVSMGAELQLPDRSWFDRDTPAPGAVDAERRCVWMTPGQGRTVLTALAAGILIAAAPADRPVRLKAPPPVAPGIAAFPRVVARPGDAAAARIDRALVQADQQPGCGDQKGAWNRRIAVTMRGPRTLSLLAYDDWYCGGPYPDTDQVALVFDLATGAPIDWKKILPPALVTQAAPDPGGTDADPVLVTSPALWGLYAKAAALLDDKECAAVLKDPAGLGTRLMLWPDAEADGLIVQQADFPHVVTACGPPITIALPELRKLGVAPAFIEAIDEAHRRGWYDKSAK